MMKKLNDIPKQNPFRVPEGYLESLSERITSNIHSGNILPENKGIVRRLRPFLLAAASVAILAIIGYTAIHLAVGNRNKNKNEEFITARYNSIYLNDIDVATLEENVAGNENFIEIPEVGRNEIIDYLLFENVNILDIYEQL
jgi:hypothetical protein